MAEGLDFSWARPSPAAIKDAGRSFVCRYVGPVRFGGKGMTKAEMQSYLAAGIAVVLNFESSGQNTTSFANGVADAQYANGEAAALGYPNAVVYFSNDKQDVTGLVDYFRGVESVIGHGRTGVYGGIGAIQILQGSGLASFYWQTYAWSGGRVAPGVHIYQYLNGQTINGASVDFDRSLQDYFGQITSATPAGGNPQPFDLTQEDDMITISSPNRGYALIGPGYFHSLAEGDAQWAGEISNKVIATTDAKFDIWRRICTQGDVNFLPPVTVPTVATDVWAWHVDGNPSDPHAAAMLTDIHTGIAALQSTPAPATPTLSDAQVQALSAAVVTGIEQSGVTLPQAERDAIAAAVRTNLIK